MIKFIKLHFIVFVLLFSIGQASDKEEIYLNHLHQGLECFRDEEELSQLTDERITSYKTLFLQMFLKEKELSGEYYHAITGMPARLIAFQPGIAPLIRGQALQIQCRFY